MTESQWTDAYYYWASMKGVKQRVKPIRYIGLQSKSERHIHKINIDGIDYAGEMWQCLTEQGNIKTFVFRIPYEEVKHVKNYNIQFANINIEPTEINAHTDGYDAFISNRPVKNKFAERETKKLRLDIEILTRLFQELNNFENSNLKMGVQVYLQRLQTPCLNTYKQWKNTNPYLKEKIMNILETKRKEYSPMT